LRARTEVYYSQGEDDKAIADAAAAMQQNPRDAGAYRIRADALCLHGLIDQGADGRLPGVGVQERPAGPLRKVEDRLGGVLVGVVEIDLGVVPLLGKALAATFLEGVGDLLEEDQAEDDVLVLGGLDVATEQIGSGPEVCLEAEVGGGVVGRGAPAGHGVSPGVE
jgi:hypothetical protein